MLRAAENRRPPGPAGQEVGILKTQMSESVINSVILALSGGLQDAYTYNVRGHVFANAQTGNVVLMSQNLMSGSFSAALSYCIPLLSFASGVFVAEGIRQRLRQSRTLHWRQIILLVEVLLLFAVGFLPRSCSGIANALVSFSCAMQVQSFRTINGYGFASTMCIGNIRAGVESFSWYLRDRKRENLMTAMYYFGVIFAFAVGAGIGGCLSLPLGYRAIWITCGLLCVSIMLMFRRQ